MQLRPFAPLAVIGAGLLMMTLATHPASADDAGAPTDVVVAPSGSDLLVSWSAPGGSSAPDDYDLRVTDPTTGAVLLERALAAAITQSRVTPTDLHGRSDVIVTVVSDYGTDQHYAGSPVRVTLPGGPVKPETPPTVRLEGRTLQIVLPEAADGVTGRVVQLFRDGALRATVSVKASRSSISRTVVAGHEYAVAYQDVTAAAAGPFSELTEPLTVKASAIGPKAVRTIRLQQVDGGLQVRWSSASTQGSDLDSYRVKVTKDGARVGSAYTAPGVRKVLLPGQAEDGTYAVTVVAKDAAGNSSTATAAVAPKG